MAKIRKTPRMARRIKQRMLAFDTSKKAIGKRMRLLRKAYGLKQDEMAAKLGITGGALSSIETGRNYPSTLTAMVAWQKFDAPLEWILAGVEGTMSDALRQRLAQSPSSSPDEPSS
jgi:transcriptional regulator with XRE-family HTH domain